LSEERPKGSKRLWVARGGRNSVPHRPTLTSSLMAALLAVGVVIGFVVARNGDHNTQATLMPGSTTTNPRVLPDRPVTPVVPATSPTTTVPVNVPPTTTAGPKWCTPADLEVSISTDSSSYALGQTVELTTEVVDLVACLFEVETPAGLTCGDSVAVDQSGEQLWPWPGQGEECSPPAATVLRPGEEESLAASWNQQVLTTDGTSEQAAPGTYDAVGMWAWVVGAGQAPYQAQATASFDVG
jgi:hypothetical protein